MKDILTALGMAWGNFLWIPSPIKRWDGNLREKMLTMLPFVGAVVGILWFLLALVLGLTPLPAPLTGFLLTLLVYGVTGGMHLDGFMDCSDAIMSRKPLEVKQRILKDSHAGAFALISLVLLLIGMFATLWSLAGLKPDWASLLSLVAIPILSRGVSGICVLSFDPMKTSQYREESPKSHKKEVLSLVVLEAVLLVILFVIATIGGSISKTVPLAISSLLTILATFLTALFSKKSLGGMSGDIAGSAICIGEVAGAIALVVSLAFTAAP